MAIGLSGTGARRRTRALLVTLAVTALGIWTADAAARSGARVLVGTPARSGPPSVAVDASGTAYVAWADTGSTPNVVDYCVLPAGATRCVSSGVLRPADGARVVDRVQVLEVGSAVVVLADVYGTVAGPLGPYEPQQEWQSIDNGRTFTAVNGGQSVAAGNADNGITQPLNAVLVPGGVIGHGFQTAGHAAPTFSVSSISAPRVCAKTTSPRCPFASLAAAAQPDQISNAGGQFASDTGVNAGVLGIFNTDYTSGNLGCPGAPASPLGTAFAYGTGLQGPGNDYAVSPGSPGSAWQVAVAQADCGVEYPAVAGGPSGFGVLEEDVRAGTTVYHPFDAATRSFDRPRVTVARTREQSPSLSQDAAGGLYATFLQGPAGALDLAYSADGGATWLGPATLDANTDGRAASVTSDVGPTGEGWAAWVDNGSVYVQQFVDTDAVSPATVGATGSSTSRSVTVTVTCASIPCSLTVTVTAGGATTARSARVRQLTLGTARVTIRRPGPRKVRVRLTRAGRRLVAAHHGRLTATVVTSQRVGRTAVKATRSVRIRPGRP